MKLFTLTRNKVYFVFLVGICCLLVISEFVDWFYFPLNLDIANISLELETFFWRMMSGFEESRLLLMAVQILI